jgi:D-serine deaminase-like pyridoxal phosphate-dependent protein
VNDGLFHNAILPYRHMHIEDLDTPAVVIDLDIMDRNLARLAEYAAGNHLNLRPHTKTHKIPEIAKLQIERGAAGITVAKPGEARVMVEGGVADLMIAYPLVTSKKADRAAELARECQLRVSLDSVEAIHALGDAAGRYGSRIGTLVEFDVGFHRCGVTTPELAISLAREVLLCPQLDFLGLMFYPGHLGRPPEEQAAAIEEVNRTLDEFYQAFHTAGIEIRVVSGGSTPTAYRSHLFHGVTEIRPGMYLLNDANLVRMGVAKFEDCALHVLVTVASNAVHGRVILDGGSKTFSSDSSRGDQVSYGMIREDPDAVFLGLSEEHGHVDIARSGRAYRVGERLRVLPNHVCATVNMHDKLYGVRNGMVEKTWNIAARGKVQ